MRRVPLLTRASCEGEHSTCRRETQETLFHALFVCQSSKTADVINVTLTFLPQIGKCVRLGVLSLRDNRVMFLPPEVGQLKELHVLDVSGNR